MLTKHADLMLTHLVIPVSVVTMMSSVMVRSRRPEAFLLTASYLRFSVRGGRVVVERITCIGTALEGISKTR